MRSALRRHRPGILRRERTIGVLGDVALSALTVFASFMLNLQRSDGGLVFPHSWQAVSLPLIAAIVLLARRAGPVVVLVVLVVLDFGYRAAGLSSDPMAIAAALGTVVAGAARRTCVAAAVGTYGAILVAVPLVGRTPLGAVIAGAFITVGLLAGLLVRRSRIVEDLHRRERELVESVRARERLLEAQEQTSALRREVHDALAGGLTLMVRMAETARISMDTESDDQVRDRLRRLADTGRDAGTEVRAAVGRTTGTAGAGTDTGTVAPDPMTDIGLVVDRYREAGLPVRTRGWSALAGLDPAVARTLVAVAREALTNVLRHAIGATAVSCALTVDDATATVVILDDGTASSASHRPGIGLRGMAERIRAIDGDLDHGRRTDGGPGWVVRARVPVRITAETEATP